MRKLTKKMQGRSYLLTLFGLLLLFGGVTFWLQLSSHKSTLNPTAAPTPGVDSGNSAKTRLSTNSSPNPTPSPSPVSNSGNTAKSAVTPSPSVGTTSYIQDFSMVARDSGQYVSTILSSSAVSGNCSVTLTSSSGSALTKKGAVISTGSTLSCDFGGVIPIQGKGIAHLIVTGLDGKSDSQDRTF